jgi:DNA-binding IclR family transcriptional regulator
LKPAQTLIRGLSVLEALAAAEGSALGATQLAARVNLDKTTTIRLVRTLCDTGYVEQNPATKGYSLTRKVLRLSAVLTWELDLRALVRPHLLALRDRFNETAHLGCLDHGQVRYVDRVESQQPIRMTSAIGQLVPLHTTALGKAILSALPDDTRDALIEGLEFSPEIPGLPFANPEELVEDLMLTRERGYAVGFIQALSIAAPLRGGKTNVLGAISVSGPKFRMEDRIPEIGEHVQKVARTISEEATLVGFLPDSDGETPVKHRPSAPHSDRRS